MFAHELSVPLSNIYTRCCISGEYPENWKVEIITPVPKQYPPEMPNQLRKISGTMWFSKIFEKFLAEAIVSDMDPSSDPSQYGNKVGMSTQHYLINLLHKILVSVDKNTPKEKYAAIIHFVDWSQAFDRQCPKLGIESFIENGVRKSIIPVLISYFQGRKMQVKWNGVFSSTRDLPGGGPQGCHMGQLMYESQSNDSGRCVEDDERFKFIDDMSLLEIINLIACGIASYNFKYQVASDIAIDQNYIPSDNIKSQDILNEVASWTNLKKMKVNEKKSKTMVVNFTTKYQFKTRLYLNDTLLENVEETTLLGTKISSDLSWTSNTNHLILKAYKRMEILRKLYSFNVPVHDLVHIYILYIRSVLEFNCCVWHFGLTKEEICDLERVQKTACKIILKQEYEDYESALSQLNLQNLNDRRAILCKRFTEKCVKNERTKAMFPLDTTRHSNKYLVTFARNDRLLYSSIPQMQRILNAK